MKKLGVTGIAVALMAATSTIAIAESHSDSSGEKRGQRGERMIEKYDLDGDGGLSQSEFEAMQSQRHTFDELDTNGDGILNREDRRERKRGGQRNSE